MAWVESCNVQPNREDPLRPPNDKPRSRRQKSPSTSTRQSPLLYHSAYTISNIPRNVRRIYLTGSRLWGLTTENPAPDGVPRSVGDPRPHVFVTDKLVGSAPRA
eukprot:5365170-Pyramimonas_sp.AAC.1